MKLLLIGANGQLGTDLLSAAAGHEVVGCTHGQLEVRDPAAVAAALTEIRPDAVVNTAAFHKVEVCEEQGACAFGVNALGALNLARTCQRHGAVLMHFSTDYVFDGAQRTPYREGDAPRPLNVYGASKLAGEQLIAAYCQRHFIVRTCGLYGRAGSSGKSGNFVETMRRKARAAEEIRVVDDQVLTPTYTVDLAATALDLLATDAYGLYHATSGGQCSWFEFASMILELEGFRARPIPVPSSALASSVCRPAYSVLAKAGLQRLGLPLLPAWEEALARYLAETR